MKLIARFNTDHEVKADDGCATSWKSGDIIVIGATGGQVDYVRKGIIVQMAQENHYHVIPGANLNFFLSDGETMFPVSPDRILH